jgi:hypothetical protein
MAAEAAKNTVEIFKRYDKILIFVIKRLSRRRGIYEVLYNAFIAEDSKYDQAAMREVL